MSKFRCGGRGGVICMLYTSDGSLTLKRRNVLHTLTTPTIKPLLRRLLWYGKITWHITCETATASFSEWTSWVVHSATHETVSCLVLSLNCSTFKAKKLPRTTLRLVRSSLSHSVTVITFVLILSSLWKHLGREVVLTCGNTLFWSLMIMILIAHRWLLNI